MTSTTDNHQIDENSAQAAAKATNQRGWRFWTILGSLCVATLAAAIESTVISTALSSIVHDLDIGANYAWVANAYLLASAAVQPIFGQLANLYGRRWTTLSALAVFLVGSGICGGANNEGMLIAGRTLQGIGGGGVNMLIELIVCDLVPLRERPKFMGVVFILFALGSGMGPFIGGVLVQDASWRWVFYINLPVAGVALITLYISLHVNYKRTTFRESIGRFDWFGSFLVITSAIAVLFALTYGGARYPWSSFRVIVPLVLGLLGLIGFHTFEAVGWAKDPLMPPHLFGNRTSAIAFYATFIHGFIFIWVLYFLPVYFQAVLGSSTTRAGVQLLPTVILMIPFAMIGAQYVEKTGRYKPVHIISVALMAIGVGTFAVLDEDSSMGMWVGLQVLQIAGMGTLTTALLPAVQASLSDDDNASSTAAFAYIRSYGAIWGISIPVAVFNNQFNEHIGWVSDASVRAALSGGNAYELGNRAFLSTLSDKVRAEVVRVFVRALRITWIVGAAIAAVSCFVTFLEKEVELRTELETEFGLKGKEEKIGAVEAGSGSDITAEDVRGSEKQGETVKSA